MTDNSKINQHIKDARYQLTKVAALTTALSSSLDAIEKELAWGEALNEVSTTAAAKSGQPTSLVFDAFKAAMATNALKTPEEVRQSLNAPLLGDPAPVFNGSNPVAAGQSVPLSTNSPLRATGQTHRPNLTDAARLLLSQGRTYQEAIETIHQRHPHLAKDNVRRAVGRAFQEKASRK